MSNKKDDISQFEVLVSSAGGIAGYRQLGVLLEIWPTIKPTVHSFVGTSIGAIINLFLNLDFTPREIIELTLNTNLMSEDFISKDKALSNHGLIDNEKFELVLSDMILTKHNRIYTLKELYQKTKKRLVTTAYNTSKDFTLLNSNVEYIDYKSHPDMSCIKAVSLSKNIPMVFERIEYEGDVYIDGGFGDPYPINHLDDGKTKILGLCISTPKQRTDTFLGYLKSCLVSSINELKIRAIRASSSMCKTIELISEDVSMLELSPYKRVEMVHHGMLTICKEFNLNISNMNVIEELLLTLCHANYSTPKANTNKNITTFFIDDQKENNDYRPKIDDVSKLSLSKNHSSVNLKNHLSNNYPNTSIKNSKNHSLKNYRDTSVDNNSLDGLKLSSLNVKPILDANKDNNTKDKKRKVHVSKPLTKNFDKESLNIKILEDSLNILPPTNVSKSEIVKMSSKIIESLLSIYVRELEEHVDNSDLSKNIKTTSDLLKSEIFNKSVDKEKINNTVPIITKQIISNKSSNLEGDNIQNNNMDSLQKMLLFYSKNGNIAKLGEESINTKNNQDKSKTVNDIHISLTTKDNNNTNLNLKQKNINPESNKNNIPVKNKEDKVNNDEVFNFEKLTKEDLKKKLD